MFILILVRLELAGAYLYREPQFDAMPETSTVAWAERVFDAHPRESRLYALAWRVPGQQLDLLESNTRRKAR
jgi:hypothetical protein